MWLLHAAGPTSSLQLLLFPASPLPSLPCTTVHAEGYLPTGASAVYPPPRLRECGAQRSEAKPRGRQMARAHPPTAPQAENSRSLDAPGCSECGGKGARRHGFVGQGRSWRRGRAGARACKLRAGVAWVRRRSASGTPKWEGLWGTQNYAAWSLRGGRQGL